MATDYMPHTDAGFQTWGQNFSTYFTANAVALGLLAADATAVATKLATFGTSLTAHATAQAAADTAKVSKDGARADLEKTIRADVKRIQANPAVTDAQRAALGITIKDTTPTHVGPPTEVPGIVVHTEDAGQHRIVFGKKPAGAIGLEIWRSVPSAPPIASAPPSTDDGWEMVALDTHSPYLAVYDAADAGKKVWYRARWVSTTMQHGPWSTPVGAVIG